MTLAAFAAAMAALFSFPGPQAVSAAPLLPSAPAASPRPRSGLWGLAAETCRFNLRSKLDRWPPCADPLQIGETAFARPVAGEAGSARRYRYAEGDPGLLQVQIDGSAGEAWAYFGFRPMATDPDGRVIRARIWPVDCPARGCRLRTAAEALAAARTSEALAFTGEPDASGRLAVWVRPAP
ncbi:MAG: hypothetical protein ACKOEY_17240 [Phenylobacterium sp.]